MNKKKLTAVAATLVALTLIITGTFAWISFQNSTTSGITGRDAAPGASTHDDIGLDGFDKDVYVENWGTEPIFVRVKLSEYMEVGSLAGTESPDKKVEKLVDYSSYEDPSTWSLYFYNTYSPFREFWELEHGGAKLYKPVAEENHVDGYIANDPTIYELTDPGVKETLSAGIKSMQEWAYNEPEAGNYWVGDEDGWFYWAQALQPGEATGLLVNNISKLKNIPGGTYYYGIHTETQMATGHGDLETPDYYINFGDSANGGWTPEASDLLGFIVAKSEAESGFYPTAPEEDDPIPAPEEDEPLPPVGPSDPVKPEEEDPTEPVENPEGIIEPIPTPNPEDNDPIVEPDPAVDPIVDPAGETEEETEDPYGETEEVEDPAADVEDPATETEDPAADVEDPAGEVEDPTVEPGAADLTKDPVKEEEEVLTAN
ncbi:MAG: hypothetical protein LBT59_08815 [Clostridiales bacterium]|jgi:hypothetical protein|nr:hypothetical protein [Clostridiales bacterium]